MRTRYFNVVATIVTSALLACGDAAVDEVTAPRIAATPAQPVTTQWPGIWEYEEYGIPSAIGLNISSDAWFEDDNRTFVARATVRFEWANDVSANLQAWLVDKNNVTVNSGSAGMHYSRAVLPVPSGDTTFTVRISTNNRTCGLLGKHSYNGRSAQNALNVNFLQITLWEQTMPETHGPDVLQPECPPSEGCATPVSRVIGGSTGILASEQEDCEAPTPPNGGGDQEAVEVCYTIWRELWIYDIVRRTLNLAAEWPVGIYCYYTPAPMT
jgi:hypothetical protein